MKRLKKKSNDAIEIAAVRITKFIGSTDSIVVHTVVFVISFILYFFGVPMDKILLIVTTIVSLEAIYLSIFIQMSVNRQARKLRSVARDVEEIQEDVEEIEKDVDEIQKDVDEIQEDVEDIQEEDETEELEEKKDEELMQKIDNSLGELMREVVELKKQSKIKRAKAKSKKISK